MSQDRARMPLRKLPLITRTFLRPRPFSPESPDSPGRQRAHLPSHRPAPWPATTPDDAGVAGIDARLADFAASPAARHLHAVVIARGGALVAEHYGQGKDRRWGQRLGVVDFTPDTLHDLRSVTKSVTGLLYGIAHEEGLAPGPDTLLADCFPAHRQELEQAGTTGLTLHHVLSMTMGLDWNEHLPYTDPRNGEIAMELARDRYQYILSRPCLEPPGQQWRYCGGATALLGDLIERGAGRSLAAYAQQRIFTPLGIEHWQWFAGSDRRPSAASGLRLAPRDLARLGRLLLDGGSWEGRQVVPASWLETASQRHTGPTWVEGLDYGHHLYLSGFGDHSSPLRWIGGIGNGGQHLMALPELDMTVVVLTGNYDGEGQGAEARAVLTEVVGPSTRAG